jgi:acid phosphatase class B
MASLICFDLDGTLANIEHRLGYIRSRPKNWSAFNAAIPHDAVNTQVAATFFALRDAGHNIVFASGRSEDTRNDTVAWLKANNFWSPTSRLYMRKSRDYRNDDIIKCEMLDDIVRDHGRKPDMWFDDRPRVVKAIRSCGVFVFDVYQGEEDF